ncbi:MAG: winged helix family transcriptional regulator, partial [Chloroflexia bacterium]|nr:winged helix family transcriptional regulator [Chloroflexia bacterium]
TRIANIGSRAVILTPSEFDLLHYFLTHQGEVCSSTRLLQEVFGYPADLADRGLVRWHIMNLRHKIELDPNNPQYIRTVPRHGYILGGLVEANSDADKLLIP